ncbi:glycosyltransferase [Marinimicrobium sp. ARAG 43.8]|uniref:glycosyltransferase n=1 Tax=Marinimicrobium sp. ARAG 43.8 TaxID=3418719 RepID=UPI003CEF9409
MNIFCSVVSHNNTKEIIEGLKPHLLTASNVNIVILDNIPDPRLHTYASSHTLSYLSNKETKGFGENHNQVFEFCLANLDMDISEDYFVVLNPDLECTPDALKALIEGMTQTDATIGAPNIFKDHALKVHEESVRKFPYIWELATSFMFKKNRTGIKRTTLRPCEVDWASGACLAFKTDTFEALNGFDKRYFLYYEDVDICWRARHLLGQTVYYFPEAKVIHPGKRKSHTLNSRHLWWHLKSAFRFSSVRLKTALFGSDSLR